MSRFLKILLSLLGLVVVLVALLLVRLVTLDPNDYKDWISSRFEQQTGRSLALAGEIGLELYPWLDLSLNGVTVGNAAGFGAEPMLQAENARIRVKTLPLLRSQFEIEAVQLQGVRVNLAVNEDGVANWADLSQAGGEPAPASGGGGIPLTNFIIGGVDVSDIGLRYEDRRSGAVYQVEDLQFAIGELIYGTPIDLNMTLAAAASQPQLNADVRLTGILNYDLDNERYQLAPLDLNAQLRGSTLPQQGAEISLATALDINLREDTLTVESLSLSGLDASLQAALRGESISGDRPVYSGDVSANGSDLAQLFRAAGVTELAGRLAELRDRSFQLTASGTLETGLAGRVEVTEMNATLLGATLDGSVQMLGTNSGEPTASGTLNAIGPDLPLVVEVVGQLTGGGSAQLTQVGRELRRVSDRRFDVSLDFNMDSGNGTLEVNDLDAQLLGATIEGGVRALGIGSESVRVVGSLDANGPDLPLFMQVGARLQGGPDSSLFQIAERLRQDADGAFTVDVQFDADLEQGNIAVPQLDINALGLQIEGNIAATNMSQRNGTVNGSLALTSNNPGPLLAAVEQQELADVLERLSVNLQVSGTRANMAVDPLRADLVLAGPQIPNSPVTLTVNAASRINLDQETVEVSAFSANGLGLDARGRLNVTGPFDAPGFNGQLELASFSPRSFLVQLNQPVPVTRDSTVLQRVALTSSFEGSLDSLAVQELALVLDDSNLTGSLNLSNGEAVSAGFDLSVDRIDVDRYLAPESPATGTAPASGEGAEIPVDLLRTLTLNGNLRVGQMTVSGLELADLRLSVNAADGQLQLAPVTTSLYQGALDASARLSVTGAEPVASLDVDLSQVDLEALLSDLAGASNVTGRGNIALAVSGSGADTTSLQRSLSGNGSVRLEDGVLRGVDVANVLRQLEVMIRTRQAGQLERGNQTAFESFSATLGIDSGVITSNDLLIQSPGFRVTGRGTLLDLSTNTIAFNLATTVDQSTATRNEQQFDIGGYSLPIACSGTLDAPRCLPDAGEILRARLQREVQDRVLDLLDRSLGSDQQSTTTPGTTTQGTPDGTATPEATTPDTTAEPAETQPPSLEEQIINRALNRIFN